MDKEKRELFVKEIKNGTVIDHIPAGRALVVLKILKITGREGNKVSILMNTDSKKLGKKDLVKIEDRYLSGREVDMIALIAPNATINIVRNYEVVEKHNVELPEEIVNVVKCANPNCITNTKEPIKPRFKVISKNPVELRCVYCNKITDEEDIMKQFTGGSI